MNISLFIVILSFFISPLFLAFTSIFYIIKNKYAGYIGLSLLLGFFAFSYIPYEGYDLNRHYEIYNSFINNGDFLNYINITSYNIGSAFLYFILYIMSLLGIKKEFLPALSVFISALIFLTIIYNEMSYKYKIIIVLFFILIFPMLNIASGIRFYLSASIFIYYTYLLIVKNVKKNYLIIFVVLIHPVNAIFLIPVFTYKYIGSFSRFLLVLSSLLLISGVCFYLSYFSSNFVLFILNNSKLFSVSYIENKSIFDNLSYNESLSLMLQLSPIFISLFILNVKKTWKNKEAYNFLSIMLFLIVVFSGISQFFIRAVLVFDLMIFVFFVSYFYELTNTRIKRFFLFPFLLFMCISSLALMNTFKSSYIPSWSKLYYPTYLIILETNITPDQYIK
ncbi:hypothetical protein [Photobacterium carnosum]|uniref:hypothetical protein n=1 Tax=Photobacterium carnosum TaxID=2023717 RepID=UPI001181973E|nr:hypothetical protein [Photobacterium carnosum]